MSKTNRKLDVLVAGELNVDIILNGIHSFPEMGKDIQADQFSFVLGSSSAIFASNIASLGAKVSFCGLIGNDYFGDYILEKLKSKNIDTSLIIRTNNCHTGITFILNYDNDRASVTYHGAMALSTINMIPFKRLKDFRHLHISSCFLMPGLLNSLQEIYSMAGKAGLTTSLDPQWDPYEKWNLDLPSVMEYLDMLLLNEREFQNIAGCTDIRPAMEKNCSKNGIIVVKQGTRGSTLYSRRSGFIQHNGYLNPRIVDAIGTGDSFNAGFILKCINGADLAECLSYGGLAGAVSTTKPGGTAAFDNPDEAIKNMMRFKKNSPYIP